MDKRMSLERKMKEWETLNTKIFERLKNNAKENKLRLNNISPETGGRCYDKNLFRFKYQKCGTCDYIYNHLSFDKGGKSITIPSGRRRGKEIHIVASKGKDEYVLREDVKRINISTGKKIYKFFKDEFFCISNVSWYSTDDIVTNISLVMMIMYLYSVRKNFPLYPDFLYFYNCTDENHLIYIEKDYESIDDFNKDPNYNNSMSPLAQKRRSNIFSVEVTKDIVFQIVLSIKFYSNLFFTHNELDYTKLRFSSTPVHVQYDKEMYMSPFRCIIFPSSYSSICSYDSKNNWWSRFFLRSKYLSSDEREMVPYDDLMIEMNGTKNYYVHDTVGIQDYLPEGKRKDYLRQRVFFYRLNRKMNFFIRLRREKGSVFGLNSFDVVVCLCSLMTLSYFNDSLLRDPKMSSVWYGLWRKSEAKTITDTLIHQKKPLDFDNVCMVLKKFYIRYDALNYLYGELS